MPSRSNQSCDADVGDVGVVIDEAVKIEICNKGK